MSGPILGAGTVHSEPISRAQANLWEKRGTAGKLLATGVEGGGRGLRGEPQGDGIVGAGGRGAFPLQEK